jgi:hypothetical protein
MRTLLVSAIAAVCAIGPLAAATDPVYASLWLYQGTWHVTPSGRPAGAKPDVLTNQCALIGKYFACQQTVNGTVGSLVVYIPTGQPGRFHNQAIAPTGRAGGLGELEIIGDRWVYSNGQLEGGKTKHYRNINTFTGRNKIHYEQSESWDEKDWKVTGSGDEVRVTDGSK